MSRSTLASARRVMIKLGSAIVTRSNGSGLALGRTANIVEQVSHLAACGRDVIVVSSGAVAAGRQIFRSKHVDHADGALPIPSRSNLRLPLASKKKYNYEDANVNTRPDNRLCAAAGQAELMALYSSMFNVYGISCGQVLVGIPDLMYASSREQTSDVIQGLVERKVIPIINENDAVVSERREGDGSVGIDVSDNDSLSAVLARELECDVLLLLSNVNGVYTNDPSDPSSEKLDLVTPSTLSSLQFGEKSKAGRGGMESKVNAAIYAMEGGVSTVIANGLEWRSILDIISGEPIGTLFAEDVVA